PLQPHAKGVSAPRIEEMRLRRIDARPDLFTWARHETAFRARAQETVADLKIDDVVRAERLDNATLHLQIASPSRPLHQHALGPHAEADSVRRGLARLKQRDELAGEREAMFCAGHEDAGLVLLLRDAGLGHVHDRAAHELRDEEIGW